MKAYCLTNLARKRASASNNPADDSPREKTPKGIKEGAGPLSRPPPRARRDAARREVRIRACTTCMDREHACSLACRAGPWGCTPSSLRRRRELHSFLGRKHKNVRLGLLCTARRQAPQPTGAPLGPQPAETRDPGIYVWVEF